MSFAQTKKSEDQACCDGGFHAPPAMRCPDPGFIPSGSTSTACQPIDRDRMEILKSLIFLLSHVRGNVYAVLAGRMCGTGLDGMGQDHDHGAIKAQLSR